MERSNRDGGMASEGTKSLDEAPELRILVLELEVRLWQMHPDL